MSTVDPLTSVLWAFIRGDLSAVEFERWLYAQHRLESELGDELYLAAISTDFSNDEAVWALRCALAVHARGRPSPRCLCIRLKTVDVVDMGTFDAPQPAFEQGRAWCHDDVFRSLQKVADRGSASWWLWAARCRSCGQAWLIGQEERQNDVFCMKRLDPRQLQEIIEDDLWPHDFDAYETLLRIGRDAGRTVLFIDPMTSSMTATIADLARARPGIAISQIADLLSLDVATASALAHAVIEREGVQITFDSGS